MLSGERGECLWSTAADNLTSRAWAYVITSWCVSVAIGATIQCCGKITCEEPWMNKHLFRVYVYTNYQASYPIGSRTANAIIMMFPSACHDIGILSSLNVTARVQIPSGCKELVLIALITNDVLRKAVRRIDRKDRFMIESTFKTSPKISNPTELVSG